MTRKEAIEILKDLWRTKYSTYLETDIRKALDTAIQALEQEPYDDAKYHEEHGEVIVDKAVWEDVKRALEQEPSGDAVSRQAVHEAIEKWAGSMNVLIALPTREIRPLLDSIHKLPSVNPQKWIPVSERLPKAGEYIGDVARYYLVQNEYGDILVARYRGEYWEQIYQLKPIDDEIVAWMPLPEPYEPQESEVRNDP